MKSNQNLEILETKISILVTVLMYYKSTEIHKWKKPFNHQNNLNFMWDWKPTVLMCSNAIEICICTYVHSGCSCQSSMNSNRQKSRRRSNNQKYPPPAFRKVRE